MLEPDFERLYDRRLAYFLDPTGTRVVPDPRYLISGEAQPTALLNRCSRVPRPVCRPGCAIPSPAARCSCAAP